MNVELLEEISLLEGTTVQDNNNHIHALRRCINSDRVALKYLYEQIQELAKYVGEIDKKIESIEVY